jgi:acetoin utilization deacetylase AcuC-like enzyme
MLAYYADIFVLPLPPQHRFPMQKYARTRQRLLDTGILSRTDLRVPEPATDAQILRAHSQAYWDKVRLGTLSDKEQRRIGFPWSPQMVERTRRVSGGTIGACRAALRDGAAVNLAGGTHHAHRDFGSGYCILNDSAIAARAMQDEGLARRVVILDCDVHQGDGTAAILQGDSSIFTFSIHGAKNFPFHKAQSDIDIELPDNTDDETYLAYLEEGASRAIAYANADLAIYIAGADPFVGDTLGRMALTMDGLARRDRLIFALCGAAGLPVAVTMGGGYAKDVDDIATIHAQTVAIAKEYRR